MKILIMGASCAGSTTLGNTLSVQLNYPYFDTDTYFWEPSEIPFTVKRHADKRMSMLRKDLESLTDLIVGGSLVSWGEAWPQFFDLVVFLYVPRNIRLQRLKDREYQRYGEKLFSDPKLVILHRDFLNWASGYDDNTTKGRTLLVHRQWLETVTCPVLEINGDTTIPQRVDLILKYLDNPSVNQS